MNKHVASWLPGSFQRTILLCNLLASLDEGGGVNQKYGGAN